MDKIHFANMCNEHGKNVINIYLSYCSKLLIKNYCLNINRRLTGKAQNASTCKDAIQLNAAKYYNVHNGKNK